LPRVDPEEDRAMSSRRVCVIGSCISGWSPPPVSPIWGGRLSGSTRPQLVEGCGLRPCSSPAWSSCAAGTADERLRFTSDPREALAGAGHAVIAYDTKVDERDESDLSEVMAPPRSWHGIWRMAPRSWSAARFPSAPASGSRRPSGAIGPRWNSASPVPENLKLGQAIERSSSRTWSSSVWRPQLPRPRASSGRHRRARVVVGIRTVEMIKHASTISWRPISLAMDGEPLR
jgi:hypothetical protein